MNITPPNPYLIRAFYEWLSDNNLTPHIIVSVDNNVSVPRKYVKNDEIILNISLSAVRKFRIGNDALECDTKFDNKVEHLYIPIGSISAIYALENNLGMNFSLTEYKNYHSSIVKTKPEKLINNTSKPDSKKKTLRKRNSNLSLVKK